jgi:hypothetical protein
MKIQIYDFATISKYAKITSYATYWVQGLRCFNVKAADDRKANTFFAD